MSLCERIFDGELAQFELEDKLSDIGAKFEKLSWDHYDNSIELWNVPSNYRLSEEAQKTVYDAGFSIVFLNHIDNWETHYSFPANQEFKSVKGWRVSYPHKRGSDERGIWVEEVIETWPKEWFTSGYAIVKKSNGESS